MAVAGIRGQRAVKSEGKPSHSKVRREFTLVELLVVIAIIGILGAMAVGALAKAREAGKLAATKATVAKINDLVMKRYETYRTRRIPWNLVLLGEGNWIQYAFLKMLFLRAFMAQGCRSIGMKSSIRRLAGYETKT